MITRDIGGHRWYIETRSYPSALMAKRAWERAERKLLPGKGNEGIGVTRLAPNPAGGVSVRADGARSGDAVVVVAMDAKVFRKAQRLLADGVEFEPAEGLVDALIARRAQVMVEQAASGEGRIVIRRPEQRGAEFNRLGQVFEPPPGRG